jgi:hypothetical protein
MSDEPNPPWLRTVWWATALLTVFASYETLHYATADSAVTGGCIRFTYDQHVIRGNPIPRWAELVFRPAERINELIHPDDKWQDGPH